VALTEARIGREVSSREGFLATDFLEAEDREAVSRAFQEGEVFTAKLPVEDNVPGGMTHHWLGAVFVPGADVDEVVSWLQEYDDHHRRFTYVEESRLLSREDDRFEIFLRLRRKKIVTVHYATEHQIVYRRHSPDRYSSVSRAVRIAELEDAGTPDEREKPPERDRGFLWRLHTYWRFQQIDSGVVVECETLSLSRGIPAALRFFIRPLLDSVPRETLEATLVPIRNYRNSTLVQASSFRSKR
jgi:hypothetical protein